MDIKRPTPVEFYHFYNDMVCMVKGLEGDYTTIDLRDESCVTGKIINVDGYMNIEMEDCYYYNTRGQRYPFESFFCRGRNIRYVHVPPEKKVQQVIQNQLNNMHMPKQSSKKTTFKGKRANQYQKELLMDISKQQE